MYHLLKYIFASILMLAVAVGGWIPARAQTRGAQKASAPRTADGDPDFYGVWFPGVVPDPDHYGLSVAEHRTCAPKVTPQGPPAVQRWAVEKRMLMGDFELIGPGLQCRPRGALGF